jgi:hypothetical protein
MKKFYLEKFWQTLPKILPPKKKILYQVLYKPECVPTCPVI